MVVVNHHLFFADVVLRDEGVAELLPACNTVIFDEAHQLPETARCSSARALSSAQLVELARDVRAGAARGRRRFARARPALAARLEKAARDLRLALGEAGARLALDARRSRLHGFPRRAREAAAQRCTMLEHALAAQAERSEGLDACARRASAARSPCSRGCARPRCRAEVRWVEVFGHAVQLHVTPLSSAELFRRQMADHPRAWIFTSATLAVGEDFGHFTRELGLPEAAHAALGEPVRLRRAGAALRAARPAGEPNAPASPTR